MMVSPRTSRYGCSADFLKCQPPLVMPPLRMILRRLLPRLFKPSEMISPPSTRESIEDLRQKRVTKNKKSAAAFTFAVSPIEKHINPFDLLNHLTCIARSEVGDRNAIHRCIGDLLPFNYQPLVNVAEDYIVNIRPKDCRGEITSRQQQG